MYKADVLKHYGAASAVARVLDISVTAVNKWGRVVPAESAIRLQEKSDGALRIDPKAYERLATKRYQSMGAAGNA